MTETPSNKGLPDWLSSAMPPAAAPTPTPSKVEGPPPPPPKPPEPEPPEVKSSVPDWMDEAPAAPAASPPASSKVEGPPAKFEEPARPVIPQWLAPEPAAPEDLDPPVPAPVPSRVEAPATPPLAPEPVASAAEPDEVRSPGPHVPAWLAYGGIALVIVLLLAFVTIQFVLPKKTKPPEPYAKNDAHAKTPTPPTPPIKPPTPPIKPPTPSTSDQEKIAKLKDAIEKATPLCDANKWDEAIKIVEEVVKTVGDPDGRGKRWIDDKKTIRDDMIKGYLQRLEEAKKLIALGNYFEALDDIRIAKSAIPERPEAAAALEELRVAIAGEPMILIPARETRVGSDDPKHEDEHPIRTVFIQTYKIERFEVTIKKYAIFCQATNRPMPKPWNDRVPPDLLELPVNFITAEDAEAYAAWLGRRLPTAEEWEKAARWIDARRFPWGDEFEKDGKIVANTKEFSGLNKRFRLMPVGSFKGPDEPNGDSPYGVSDMAGNVWEWTATAVNDAASGKICRVVKGGSYYIDADAARAANIMLEEPAHSAPDLGFRCVCDVHD